MHRQRIAGLKVVGLALLAFALLGAKKPVVGQPAPDFQLVLVDGSKLQLHDLRGQVVILNFWATWCVPCKEELPLLDAYYRLQQSHGLRVFAVTTEDSVPNSQLKPLFRAMAIQPVRRLSGPYRILEGVPTNYVIDRAGIVRFAHAGAFDLDALNQVLIPLLKEPPPDETDPAS